MSCFHMQALNALGKWDGEIKSNQDIEDSDTLGSWVGVTNW